MCGSMHKWHIGKRLQRVFGAITRQLYLTYSLTQITDISNSRAVVCYVERPYTTCSFRVMH